MNSLADGRPIAPEYLHNIVETELTDGALRFYRVPRSLLPHLNGSAVAHSTSTTACELRFRLASPSCRIVLRRMPDTNPQSKAPAAVLAAVYYGDFQVLWYALQLGDTEFTITPPTFPQELLPHRQRFHPELIRVLLPKAPETRLVALEGEIQPPRPGDVPARTYLAYGSSITHGARSPLVTQTYPALIAEAFHADLLNLGFGGGAQLEPELADWMAARPDWHAASLEMGINVIGNLDVPSFRARVRRFLAPFAADPRQRPVACFDLLPFRDELAGQSEKAQKATHFRAVVSEEVQCLNLPHIRHLPYAPSLGPVAGLSEDLLHPAAAGFITLASNLNRELKAFTPFANALTPQ